MQRKRGEDPKAPTKFLAAPRPDIELEGPMKRRQVEATANKQGIAGVVEIVKESYVDHNQKTVWRYDLKVVLHRLQAC